MLALPIAKRGREWRQVWRVIPQEGLDRHLEPFGRFSRRADAALWLLPGRDWQCDRSLLPSGGFRLTRAFRLNDRVTDGPK